MEKANTVAIAEETLKNLEIITDVQRYALSVGAVTVYRRSVVFINHTITLSKGEEKPNVSCGILVKDVGSP